MNIYFLGFYIYPELGEMVSETNYYGIPKDISKNGFDHKGQLCEVQLGRFGEYLGKLLYSNITGATYFGYWFYLLFINIYIHTQLFTFHDRIRFAK